MFIVLLLCLFLTGGDAALWGEKRVREMRRMRTECLHRDHAAQIAYLFPAASMERDNREARSLDYLGSLLTGGTKFCSAYVQMTKHAISRIEYCAHMASRDGKTQEEIDRWGATLKVFNERNGATQQGCAIVEENMTDDEKRKYRGILSPLNKCISDIQHRSAKGLIREQFGEEKQGF